MQYITCGVRKRVAYVVYVLIFLGAPLFIGLHVADAASASVNATGIFVRTNIERYHAGLPILRTNDALTKVAAIKMSDLFARQYFAHEAPTGETVGDLAKGVGYQYLAVGENLALGDFKDSKDVVDAWMDSPGHRANILSETYTEIGIAAGRGYYNGRYTWIVVQSFGLPRSSCPRVDTALKKELDALEHTLGMLEDIAAIREARIEEAKEVRDPHINAYVDAYNLAVKVYNTMVMRYKEKAREYNTSVKEYNACLSEKVISKETHE